jgi:UDP-N-acetyl-2-amino-2-deoxyglucuronate dehydrogenase
MKAIKDTGNNLLAALDKNDSVGIIDNYFPSADFFTEFERFDRHIEKLKRQGTRIDYLSICSPNYLHDAHIRFGLRNGVDVICEKPLVLNPWNLDALAQIEEETGKKIYSILQLRLHPAVVSLREKVLQAPKNKRFNIDLTYIASRGNWYQHSWKGDLSKSGGIVTNIGMHFLDMLTWIFGKVLTSEVRAHDSRRAAGMLQLERATVNWMVSVDSNDIPAKETVNRRTWKHLRIDNDEVELSDGFLDLHTRSYEEILKGNGFMLEETREAISLAHQIRNAKPYHVN